MPSADAARLPSRPVTPTPSQLPPVPSSPVYSVASTANPMSQFNLPLPPAPRPAHAVLSKADLGHSQQAYSDLVASAKSYRLALAALSVAASAFGSALEACARLKEARAEPIAPSAAGTASMSASFTAPRPACTADTLLAASGVQHLIANHQQILSEAVYRAFEVPLLHDLDRWQAVIDGEEEEYQHRIKAQSREVKRLEKEGLKLHKQRRRDVARFRAHLVELTSKLDGLTTLHADHARSLLRESQETSARIVDASCSLVRAEVDIFEGLARKGWTGGGLEDLLEKGQDLFATDDAGGHASAAAGPGEPPTLFSILPPKSILADAATSDASPCAGSPRASSPRAAAAHVRGDSLLAMDGDRYQSLVAVASDARRSAPATGDADSVFSVDFNRPRGARPFSPQPVRRIPADVTFDSLGVAALRLNSIDDDDDDDDDDADDDADVSHGSSGSGGGANRGGTNRGGANRGSANGSSSGSGSANGNGGSTRSGSDNNGGGGGDGDDGAAPSGHGGDTSGRQRPEHGGGSQDADAVPSHDAEAPCRGRRPSRASGTSPHGSLAAASARSSPPPRRPPPPPEEPPSRAAEAARE